MFLDLLFHEFPFSRPSPLPSKRRLEAERPAKLHLAVAWLAILGQLGPADIERQVESGDEPGVAYLMIGPETNARVAEKPDPVSGKRLRRASKAVGKIGEGSQSPRD